MNAARGRIYAIVPAGGVGARAAAAAAASSASAAAGPVPKQYFQLAGKPMIAHTLKALLRAEDITQMVVGIAPTDTIFARCVPLQDPRLTVLPCGGETRMDTVLNCAHQLPLEDGDWLLVHDAARPALPLSCLNALMAHCLQCGEGGILALPVADTLKQSDETQKVAKTVPRQGMWQAQTPQMFPALVLVEALEAARKAGLSTTDEAGAMERLSHPVHLIKGSFYNHKVTYPEDVMLMDFLLSQNQSR